MIGTSVSEVMATLEDLLLAAQTPSGEGGNPIVLQYQAFDANLLEEVRVVMSDNNYVDPYSEGEPVTIKADEFIKKSLVNDFRFVVMAIVRDFSYGPTTKHVVMTVLVKLKATA